MIYAEVARNFDALPHVMRLVDTFFAARHEKKETRFAVELALEEIFTNIVKYNRKGHGPIRIELDACDGEVVVTVTDPDSPPFDPFEMPDPDVNQPLERRDPGGLGIHLVRKFMDGIEYSHADGSATVKLRKRMD